MMSGLPIEPRSNSVTPWSVKVGDLYCLTTRATCPDCGSPNAQRVLCPDDVCEANGACNCGFLWDWWLELHSPFRLDCGAGCQGCDACDPPGPV